jgi:hypothetical protein
MSSFKSLKDLLDTNYAIRSDSNSKNYKTRRTSEAFDFLHLIRDWPIIVGEKLATKTVPLKNQRKTLIILSNHSAYSEQLSFMSDKIIDKINEHFPMLHGKIAQIKYMTNPAHFKAQQERAKVLKKSAPKEITEITHKFSPQDQALLKEADNYFSDIENEEIKKSLKSIFIQLHKSK